LGGGGYPYTALVGILTEGEPHGRTCTETGAGRSKSRSWVSWDSEPIITGLVKAGSDLTLTCSMRRAKSIVHGFGGNLRKEEATRRIWTNSKDNIRMDLREIEWTTFV
jgi:hypothetical protein